MKAHRLVKCRIAQKLTKWLLFCVIQGGNGVKGIYFGFFYQTYTSCSKNLFLTLLVFCPIHHNDWFRPTSIVGSTGERRSDSKRRRRVRRCSFWRAHLDNAASGVAHAASRQTVRPQAEAAGGCRNRQRRTNAETRWCYWVIHDFAI